MTSQYEYADFVPEGFDATPRTVAVLDLPAPYPQIIRLAFERAGTRDGVRLGAPVVTIHKDERTGRDIIHAIAGAI